jgi:hypothetical protein
MSYDIFLRSPKCEHCGQYRSEPELPEPTYNLTPIFDFALSGEPLPSADVSESAVVLFGKKTVRPRGLRLLDDRLAKETMADINRARDRMLDPRLREQFIGLEPANKWGTLADAISVMCKLREAAEEYPDFKWDIR